MEPSARERSRNFSRDPTTRFLIDIKHQNFHTISVPPAAFGRYEKRFAPSAWILVARLLRSYAPLRAEWKGDVV